MKNIMAFASFFLKEIVRGGRAYYTWLVCLGLLIAIGIAGYLEQFLHGHIVSNMRDPVPWGLFIGTYAFLVGVAAAAMALAVPGYVYNWKPIKDIVVLGEIIAISAVIMAILFIMADLGRPERFWHLLPFLGKPNIPYSMIAMNVMVLNGYLVLNVVLVFYFLYCSYADRPYNKAFFMALMLFSIPAAISIHTTTAFIFNVLPARPYWNSAILVPRFIATALCAGPALMILAFQVLRKAANINIRDEALVKIAEITAIVLFVNLLLFFAEVVTEFRSATAHTVHMQFYFTGIGDHVGLAGWAWFGAVVQRAGVPAPADTQDAEESRHHEPRLRARLHRSLHREGHRPGSPRLHARIAGRGLRVLPVARGGDDRHRHRRSRSPGLYPAQQGRHPAHLQRAPRGGRPSSGRREPEARLQARSGAALAARWSQSLRPLEERHRRRTE